MASGKRETVRATALDEATSAYVWTDPARRDAGPPPTLAEVLRDKIAEHGPTDVHQLLGLSRNSLLGLAAGAPSQPGTLHLAQTRLPLLGRLDDIADHDAAKKSAP